jgi:thiol-disulfide isomerase/thioredoxin
MEGMSPLLKKKSLWIGLLSFVVLAWAAQTAYRGLSTQQEEVSYKLLVEGDIFPQKMPLLTREGKLTTFADFSGKVVLLNYWAGWCGPCLKEMPSLYELHKKFADRGFTVLGISMDEDFGQGLGTLNRIAGAAPFPHFKGQEQAVSARFPIEGLPFTVVLDRSGKILYARAGERDWSNAESMKFIEGLL